MESFWQLRCLWRDVNEIWWRNPLSDKKNEEREGKRERERRVMIISDDRSREWSTRRGVMKTLRDLRRRHRGNFCREAAVYLRIAIISGATRYRKNDAPSPLANASINILKNRDGEERSDVAPAAFTLFDIPHIPAGINSMLLVIHRVSSETPFYNSPRSYRIAGTRKLFSVPEHTEHIYHCNTISCLWNWSLYMWDFINNTMYGVHTQIEE